MKTSDIFKINRSSRRINESLHKVFGKKLNLESFNLDQLQDARNKLRTQISQVRNEAGFNENLENEAFTQAQWMLDAINAEISQREEFTIEAEELEEKAPEGWEGTVKAMKKHKDIDNPWALAHYMKGKGYKSHKKSDGSDKKEDINTNEAYINSAEDAIELLADLRKQSKMAELGQGDPVRPNQIVNDLWDVITWIEANMGDSGKKESIQHESTQGDKMQKVTEGEIQQASAIVTAKTMVDRVGRWIEELSGMENDTLLQLGDSIRDEMGSEQAKNFISAVAPAIQAALENLKTTRETLATGVRTLTGEEQGAEMLGAEPEEGGMGDMAEPAAPDEMNMPAEEPAADEFAAAEPAAGGAEAAGREQRESIQYQNRLLKVLAG